MIKSKKRWFLISIRLFGSILLTYLGFKELSATLLENELSVAKMFFQGFIVSMGILNLALVLITYEIQVTEKELIKKSLFGLYEKKFSRDRIKRYVEFNFDSESLYSKLLLLLGDNVNIEISSIDISNYNKVKNEIIKGLDEDKTYKRSFEKHWNNAVLIILVLVMIVMYGYKIFEN